MSGRYQSPPLAEALCQFGFVPAHKWDPTSPARMFGRLERDFLVQQIGNVVRIVRPIKYLNLPEAKERV